MSGLSLRRSGFSEEMRIITKDVKWWIILIVFFGILGGFAQVYFKFLIYTTYIDVILNMIYFLIGSISVYYYSTSSKELQKDMDLLSEYKKKEDEQMK